MSAPAKCSNIDEIEIIAFHVANLVKLAQQCVAELYKNSTPEISTDLGQLDALIFVTADLAQRVATGIAELPPLLRRR